MSSEFCAQKGHCWHEPDGSNYARHSERPQETVHVVCCDCDTTAIVPMHAAYTAPPSGPPARKIHGRFKPVPPKAA